MTEPITLAVARMKTMPWAIYRVRRLYHAPANAIRSEEFYTVAPAQAQDKELDTFANAWADHTDEALVRLERRIDTAITVVQQALIESQSRSKAA